MYKNKIEVPPVSVLWLDISYEEDARISKAIRRYVKIGNVFIIYPSDVPELIFVTCSKAIASIERIPSTIICFSDSSMYKAQGVLNSLLGEKKQSIVTYKKVSGEGRIKTMMNNINNHNRTDMRTRQISLTV